MSKSDEPIRRISEAVADAQEVPVDELEACHHDPVDTHAIRTLEEHSASPWTLSFGLPDHQITVSSDGIVVDGGETAWVRFRDAPPFSLGATGCRHGAARLIARGLAATRLPRTSPAVSMWSLADGQRPNPAPGHPRVCASRRSPTSATATR